VAGCAQVSRPPVASGLGTVTVLTLDPARGLDPVDRDVVLADADTVYASATGLYVATSPWTAVTAGVTASPAAGGGVTRLHRFDIADPRVTRYAASGRVTGTLLGQWSMSEHEGVLRVASTREPGWGPGGRAGEASEALVTTLRPRGGALVPVGRLGGLGRGERLVGVRFMGGTGYLVTFRQTDPLWVVDLSDPARPRVRGELTLPGYSAYLHPVGDGLLLGIGQDADARGRTLGTKVSLFDVTDPGRPALLDDVRLDGAWSEAEADHQAVLWWAPRDLLAVPVTDPSGAGNRAVGVRLRGRALVRAGEVRQPVAPHGWAPPVTRILVAGGALLAVSEAGVRAAALDEDLTPGPWLAFG
jgi:hypothetical protein